MHGTRQKNNVVLILPEGAQSPCHSRQRKRCVPCRPAMIVPPPPLEGTGEA